MGDEIAIDTRKGEIRTRRARSSRRFKIQPDTLGDEFRAGGRIPLIIGRSLTDRARTRSGWARPTSSAEENPEPKTGQGYTLAQKMVGKACGIPGALPGWSCEPKMTTVGTQDTTGPMTADELTELACLKFQAPTVMQSFCHTAAYPKPVDVKMHQTLPAFTSSAAACRCARATASSTRGSIACCCPTRWAPVATRHTRFPIGISFPAGSGLVAFAGALGFMPLDMPESVLVRFKGELQPGITLRDVVNAIPYVAIQQGLLTVPKKGKKNVFNGRILEMEGLPNLTVEQAFELTDAAAERSAAAAAWPFPRRRSPPTCAPTWRCMKWMIADGYQDAETLEGRIAAAEKWLAKPELLKADANAEYAAVIEIDLAEITEPILACPNDPDDVKLLTEVAGEKIDDVFIGSCMTNIGHFRAAGEGLEGPEVQPGRPHLDLPADAHGPAAAQATRPTSACSAQVGARIEIPGCSLCMGNQARVPDKVNVFSTSTRNFDDRMGNGARVYLGSAELGAVASNLGRLPTKEEYFAAYNEKIAPRFEKVYRYLQFDELAGTRRPTRRGCASSPDAGTASRRSRPASGAPGTGRSRSGSLRSGRGRRPASPRLQRPGASRISLGCPGWNGSR